MAKVVDNCAKVLCATCLSQPPFFLCACKVEVSLPLSCSGAVLGWWMQNSVVAVWRFHSVNPFCSSMVVNWWLVLKKRIDRC